MTTEGLSRRHALAGAATVGLGLPLLAACGSDEPDAGTDAGGSSPGGASGPLAKTSEVEVGGAVFIDDPSVVITQPAEGEFHAFSRTCPHQKCPVTDIQDGKIHCDCHQSLFDMTTGDNVGGPAPSPLTELEITVEGGEISLA